MKHLTHLAFGVCVFLAGCSLFVQPESTRNDHLLHTDRTAYIARQVHEGERPRYGFTLVARFENTTGRTIYLGRCYPDLPHPTYGVRLLNSRDDDTSRAAWSKMWACVGHETPIEVKAGAARVDTLHLSGPNAWPHGSNEPLGVLEGEFRLVYDVQTCRKEVGCDLPDSLAQSNRFEVSLPR